MLLKKILIFILIILIYSESKNENFEITNFEITNFDSSTYLQKMNDIDYRIKWAMGKWYNKKCITDW